MTSIRAFSEILRDAEGLKPEDLTRYASIIHAEAIRLTRLLDDLLDLSVLKNGQVSLNLRDGRLSDVIAHAIAAAGSDMHPLRVRRVGPAEGIFLTTDLDRLAQVFINLIANAQKYCDAPRPELTIAVTRREGRILVDFIDNGAGIPPESQGMIFEKFYRISDRQAGGAGLGLAICREIMDRLGGTLGYLPGQGGAAFRVSLPVAQRMAAQ